MDRVAEVTRDCFDALIQLRRADPGSVPAAPVLHEQLRRFVDAMYTRAAQAGLAREDVDDMAYAVVALADEVVLSCSPALRESWPRQSLQLHYFRENVAGEGFFTRLEAVRRDPRRREVLHVYYLALVLGFQGRYRVRGGDLELMSLIEELQRELARSARVEFEALSPAGVLPEEGGRAARRTTLLAVGIGLAAAGVLALVYLTLYLSLDASAGAVVEQVARANLH